MDGQKPFLMRVTASGSCSQHFNLIACCCPVERSNNKTLLSTKKVNFKVHTFIVIKGTLCYCFPNKNIAA